MSNFSDVFDELMEIDDIFNDSKLDSSYPQNRRKSVRYVRKDITASISQEDIFGTYSLFSYSQVFRVKLIDISSRGALVGVPTKLTLKVNQKIMLTLIFDSNKKFEIPAKVVHNLTQGKRFYGLKFHRPNDELGDHLLETQADLIFR